MSGAEKTHNRVTLHDVARRAGVSIASVSRLVNGQTVKPNLEGRIQEAISSLNYRPNSAGRALRARRTDQICLSVPDISNPVYQAITRGVQSGFVGTDYRLMLAPRILSVDDILQLINSLNSNYADGFILLSLVDDPRIKKAISELDIPVVTIGNVDVDSAIDTIKVASGALEIAVNFLNKKYGKKILFLNGPASTIPGRSRRKGFISAMNKVDPTPEKHIIEADSFSVEGAVKALKTVKKIDSYKSIICANDLLAAGALRHLASIGIKVPTEMAVMGIDNTDLATILNPSLTTIDYGAERRGQLAASFILERLLNPEIATRRIEIKPLLVERESA